MQTSEAVKTCNRTKYSKRIEAKFCLDSRHYDKSVLVSVLKKDLDITFQSGSQQLPKFHFEFSGLALFSDNAQKQYNLHSAEFL